MTKLLASFMLASVAMFSLQAHALRTLSLGPNQSQHFRSPIALNANCTIQSNNQAANVIKISVLSNHGVVNGKTLSPGESTSVSVRHNSTITVSAEAGTEIDLLNLSAEGLLASCVTSA